MKEAGQLNSKELRAVIKDLNEILPKDSRINMFGMSKVEMFQAFVSKIELIAKDEPELAEKFPENAINFYNANVSEADEEPEDKTEGTDDESEDSKEKEKKAKAEEKKKEKKKVKDKKEKEKKEPKEKKEAVERTAWGHQVTKQAGMIDLALMEGNTMEDIMEKTGLRKGRIGSHMNHLVKKKGATIAFSEEDGVYKLPEAPPAE